jgi:hypothetical protein
MYTSTIHFATSPEPYLYNLARPSTRLPSSSKAIFFPSLKLSCNAPAILTAS